MSLVAPALECLAVPLVLADAAAGASSLSRFLDTAFHPMALFGWIGQTLFFSRFLIQWIVSEREQRSTIPLAFWYLSVGGGAMFLIYALWRHDLVLTVGQAVGLTVYSRNLVLIARSRHVAAEAPVNG